MLCDYILLGINSKTLEFSEKSPFNLGAFHSNQHWNWIKQGREIVQFCFIVQTKWCANT